MTPRLPTEDDGLPGTYTIVPPPLGHPPTNILLLLHGLGDTHTPFTTFARQLNLPETACLSLCAPGRMPFDIEGFHWGDDIIFDEADGSIDVDTGLTKSTIFVLDDVIRAVLVGKCGFSLRGIMIFGFGQGGMLGLHIANELGIEELGGVISIGGGLPARSPLREVRKKSRTPVLVCKGYRKSGVEYEDEERIKDTFEYVEVKEWRRTGDGMPSNRDEMMPIMQFFARRLRSLRGVPKGAVEIT